MAFPSKVFDQQLFAF